MAHPVRRPERGADAFMLVAWGEDPKTGNRRRFQKAFRGSPEEADAANVEWEDEVESGWMAEGGNRTLAAFAEEWWEAHGPTLAETTRPGYRGRLDNHILPKLGKRRLRKLTPGVIKGFYGKLPTTATALACHRLLRKMLKDAERWRYIDRNPMTLVDTPRHRPKKRRTWKGPQLAAFLAAVEGDPWEAVWRLEAVTGMRRAELCGLQWDDINFDTGSIAITRTRTTAGGKVVEKPPKSEAGERELLVDRDTLAMLREHRHHQAETLMALGVATRPVWVLAWDEGSPVHPNALYARFRKLADAAGLPRIVLHEVRHSVGTFQMDQGVDDNVVSRRLGHSSVGFTRSTYIHGLPAQEQAAVQSMSTLYRAQNRDQRRDQPDFTGGERENPKGTN